MNIFKVLDVLKFSSSIGLKMVSGRCCLLLVVAKITLIIALRPFRTQTGHFAVAGSLTHEWMVDRTHFGLHIGEKPSVYRSKISHNILTDYFHMMLNFCVVKYQLLIDF
jgi:hypothetical protein